jgi:hypothetical protein
VNGSFWWRRCTATDRVAALLTVCGCHGRWWHGAVVGLSLALGGSASATAATVRVLPSAPPLQSWDQLRYVADPDEQNQVLVQRSTDTSMPDSLTISDAGAVLIPGNSCTRLDEHTARCNPLPASMPFEIPHHVQTARFDLGNLDDRLTTAASLASSGMSLLRSRGGDGDDVLTSEVRSFLYGDLGDDTLIGGDDSDKLFGGAGDDELVGRSRPDVLNGGGGRDELRGGADDDDLTDGDRDDATGAAGPGPDLLDGGPDCTGCYTVFGDTVSYRSRYAPVIVDLADPRPDGEQGEADVLSRVESLIGGRGRDRLAGNGKPNELDGRAGPDRLFGRAGRDVFHNGGGLIACGADQDLVSRGLSARDYLQPDCERVLVDANYPLLQHEMLAYPTITDDAATYRVSCPERDSDYDEPEDPKTDYCGGSLTIREASRRHRLLARATFPLGPWRQHALGARLTRLGRLLAHRSHGVPATVALVGYHFDPPTRWSIQLRASR